MNKSLPKVLRRVEETATDLLASNATSRQVLENIIAVLTPCAVAYKASGGRQLPDVALLESVASKLVAICAATYDAQTTDPVRLEPEKTTAVQ